MKTTFTVKQILEPDYGCEERPDGYIAMDKVILEDSEGQEKTVEVPDKELYAKDINVGDQVSFDEENQIQRIE